MIDMEEYDVDHKVLAIVCFGPALETTGLHPAAYYQVTIDPNSCSPGGDYIRFGLYQGDEIQGWQRVSAMTILEILGDSNANLQNGVDLGLDEPSTVRMMKVV